MLFIRYKNHKIVPSKFDPSKWTPQQKVMVAGWTLAELQAFAEWCEQLRQPEGAPFPFNTRSMPEGCEIVPDPWFTFRTIKAKFETVIKEHSSKDIITFYAPSATTNVRQFFRNWTVLQHLEKSLGYHIEGTFDTNRSRFQLDRLDLYNSEGTWVRKPVVSSQMVGRLAFFQWDTDPPKIEAKKTETIRERVERIKAHFDKHPKLWIALTEWAAQRSKDQHLWTDANITKAESLIAQIDTYT